MANKSVIHTDKAPKAIGTYSQAVKAGDTVYLSGQIPLDPETMEVVAGDFAAKTRQVFENLKAVCEAAGGELKDIVKLNIYHLLPGAVSSPCRSRRCSPAQGCAGGNGSGDGAQLTQAGFIRQKERQLRLPFFVQGRGCSWSIMAR